MDIDLEQLQKDTCERVGAPYFGCDLNLKVGVARNVKEGFRPINGMRIKEENGTCGWYIWAGQELSQAPDFFLPLHAAHLHEWSPLVMAYLGLPPGWRFLIAEGYEDVWEDAKLLTY